MTERYLPAYMTAGDVRAVLGLISDTHMPQRCRELPAAVFDALSGADVLLHAGDVGELWVLDRLGEIAPVVAVHGNDDTPAAMRELPHQQVLSAGGQRILLWHSHRPQRSDEVAAGEQPFITADDILSEVEGDAAVPAEDKAYVRSLVAKAV